MKFVRPSIKEYQGTNMNKGLLGTSSPPGTAER